MTIEEKIRDAAWNYADSRGHGPLDFTDLADAYEEGANWGISEAFRWREIEKELPEVKKNA